MACRSSSKGSGLHVQSQLIWISQIEIDRCLAEADEYFPRETGGAFMGYWSDEHQVVVTAMIAAGPQARHNRNSFQPDQQWQVDHIAEHYDRSGRMDGYLGDWHTHPHAPSAQLSTMDLATLRRIVRERRARAPRPISVIFFGQPLQWSWRAWIAHESRSYIRRGLRVLDAEVRAF